MSKRLEVVAGLVALSLAMPGIASAAWSAAGLGSGATRALVMPTGPTPTISVTGRNVAVSWSAVTLPGGTSVAGYRVARYVAGTGVPATILSACTGTIAALTCTEAAVPPGTWRYGITPLRNAWTGSEGSWSSNAVVGSPTFSFSSSAAITALPSTRPGSLANFVTGETVQFRLDSPAGTLLTGSTTPSTIGAAGSATTSVTIPAGTTQGAHTVYAVGSGGSQASASITVDTVAPVVSAAAIGKTAGGLTGFIRQGGTYYVYAQVTDATSAVGTVTASVTNVTTGSTAVAMTAGSYSAGGVSYNYRSASLTANASLSAGSKTFTITAADANGTSGTTSGFSVTVDNTAPTATNVQTSNASGGTVGRAEAGDTMTLTYGETMEPISIVAGWTGTSMSVTVRLVDGGAGNDQIQIYDSSNVTQLPLGSIGL
ncbi:MAG TPA: hypothetical protein VIB62_08845, partial [Actinomycetota bacterium]